MLARFGSRLRLRLSDWPAHRERIGLADQSLPIPPVESLSAPGRRVRVAAAITVILRG